MSCPSPVRDKSSLVIAQSEDGIMTEKLGNLISDTRCSCLLGPALLGLTVWSASQKRHELFMFSLPQSGAFLSSRTLLSTLPAPTSASLQRASMLSSAKVASIQLGDGPLQAVGRRQECRSAMFKLLKHVRGQVQTV